MLHAQRSSPSLACLRPPLTAQFTQPAGLPQAAPHLIWFLRDSLLASRANWALACALAKV
jgi:hypothetical protein